MSDYDATYGEGPQEPPREVEPEPRYVWPAHWRDRHEHPHDRGDCVRCAREQAWVEWHEDCPCMDHDWSREDVGSPAVPEWVWVCSECCRVQGPAWVAS